MTNIKLMLKKVLTLLKAYYIMNNVLKKTYRLIPSGRGGMADALG
ncbi:hypothetical protein [Staphylococcus coagulans]|nr:hypothetical protein [Staphylococcus coagulans]